MELQKGCWSSAALKCYLPYPITHLPSSQQPLLILTAHRRPVSSSFSYRYNRKYKTSTLITTTTTTTTATSIPPLTPNPSSFISPKFTCFLHLGLHDIAAITHNKVLIAAGVSAAIGQLSKPFTSQLLYGRDFDLKAAFQAGGFPSTHSSAVIATATSLAFERGFSDSIFGLTVVYAGLVMYDAQGVRREVGIHAKALNKVLREGQTKSKVVSKDGDDWNEVCLQRSSSSTINDEGNKVAPLIIKEGRPCPCVPNPANASPLLRKSTDNDEVRQTNEVQVEVASNITAAEEESEDPSSSLTLMKESVGHSEVEVIAGALLGFVVGTIIYATV